MNLESILKKELGDVNRGIIRTRRTLAQLLKNPVLTDASREIRLSEKCLERISGSCNLPQSRILLPITFFIPAGSYEGYLLSEDDARVVESLNVRVVHRASRYWVRKSHIRALESEFPGCFQSVLLP